MGDTRIVADVKLSRDGRWERWRDVTGEELTRMAFEGAIVEYVLSVEGPGGVELPVDELYPGHSEDSS